MTPSGSQRFTSPTQVVALMVVLVTLLVDLALGPDLVLTPLVITGPLVAATAGPVRYTVFAGLTALAGSFVLGFANDLEFSRRHYVSMITVLIGTVMGVELARRRERRERQLRRAMPKVDQATRLVSAMHSGQMGEWRYTLADDQVHVDEEVARAFGVDDGSTEITPARWLEKVDVRDRDHVLRDMQRALERQTSFRFDLRCTWADGATHWLEVVGEPTYADDGRLIGGQGLVWNVDERHRELDERARLLEVERYARLRAEYVARVHDVLSRSVDVEEILQQVTRASVPDLADWCNAVFVVDRQRDAPLIVAAHDDPETEAWSKEVLERFPYDPDANFGAARVIRDGQREVIDHLSSVQDLVDDDGQRDVLSHGAVDSVVTVPILGQLGLLGSLQLIRGAHRPSFTDADISLAEELASRCGAALNSAVLLARQQTSRDALETLQRVSGWLARAVTREDVAHATVSHGTVGLTADGGCVYAFDEEQVLMPLSSIALETSVREGWLKAYALRAVAEERLIVETTLSARARTVLAAPLRILDRVTGAMVFVFDARRELVADELAMVVTLASRCAGALERAALYERERASVLMLQRRLLPQVPAIPAWLEVGYCYEPASGGQVGGDWFQLINVDDEQVVAVVGDAVGHGLGAAAAMGQLKSSVATAVSINPDPGEVLRTVDRFADASTETLAATAVVTSLDRNGACRVASAGHPPPVLLHCDGTSEVLAGGRRPLLGYGEGAPIAAAHRRLTVGDTVVLYSDGLVERRREVIDAGIDRLRRLLVELQRDPLQDVCEQLIGGLSGEGTTDDDIALLLLRYSGADAGANGDRPRR